MEQVTSRLIRVFLATLLVLAVNGSAAAARQVSSRASKNVTRASWYGTSFKGQRTASGAVFNPQRLTAAHPTLDLGSQVKVTDLRSGRSVIVQITDRGPYLPGRGIDLSYAAARRLGIVQRGIARVRVEVLEQQQPASPAPIITALCGPAMPWLPKAIVE